MFAEDLWRPNNGCEYCEVVGGIFQQQEQWITAAGVAFYVGSVQLLFLPCCAQCWINEHLTKTTEQ